jgi:hypothetical protein
MGNGHAWLAAETTALQAAAHLWWIVLWCKFQESKPKDSSDCRVLRERSTSSFNYFPPLGHRALWPNCTRPVSLSLICLIKYSSLLAAFQRHNAVSDLVSIRRLMRTLNIKSGFVCESSWSCDFSEVFIVAIMQKFSSRVASKEILARA